MDDFFKSRRGSKFFDLDLPNIASQLERIAEAMERKNMIEEKRLLLEQRIHRRSKKSEDLENPDNLENNI